jgi:hypothetical protein
LNAHDDDFVGRAFFRIRVQDHIPRKEVSAHETRSANEFEQIERLVAKELGSVSAYARRATLIYGPRVTKESSR